MLWKGGAGGRAQSIFGSNTHMHYYTQNQTGHKAENQMGASLLATKRLTPDGLRLCNLRRAYIWKCEA